MIETYGISNVQFGLLFSIYSLPNIFLSLATGVLIDKLGIRKAIVIFTFTIMSGQILFALSSYAESYRMALIGRLIMG